jgi:membrane protein required for colicin V production
VLLVRLGAKIIESMIELAMLGWANRVGGVLLYLLMYFFAFSIVLFYAVKLGLLKSQMLQASNTYPLLEPLAPRVISALGALLPWFKNTFGQLEQFFSSLPQDATT